MLAESVGREAPIDQVVENSVDVVDAVILKVQVIGVFPTSMANGGFMSWVNGDSAFQVLITLSLPAANASGDPQILLRRKTIYFDASKARRR